MSKRVYIVAVADFTFQRSEEESSRKLHLKKFYFLPSVIARVRPSVMSASRKMKTKTRKRKRSAAGKDEHHACNICAEPCAESDVCVSRGVQVQCAHQPCLACILQWAEEDTTEKEICAVCLDPCGASDSRAPHGVYLQCTHRFCWTCIEQWSKEATVCPVCKAVFTEILEPRGPARTRMKRWKVAKKKQSVPYQEDFDAEEEEEEELEFDDFIDPSMFGFIVTDAMYTAPDEEWTLASYASTHFSMRAV